MTVGDSFSTLRFLPRGLKQRNGEDDTHLEDLFEWELGSAQVPTRRVEQFLCNR